MVYLTNKTEDYQQWNHTVNIGMKKEDQERNRTIVINITNDQFFLFFVKEGMSNLRCNDKKCEMYVHLHLISGIWSSLWDLENNEIFCQFFGNFLLIMLLPRFNKLKATRKSNEILKKYNSLA